MKWKRKDMGSMNNEIRSYAKYYLRRNRKLILLIFAILFVLMPFLLYNQGDYQYGIGEVIQTIVLFSIAGGCLAFLMPLLNYRFMYGKRSSDLFFSLPIKKGKLFDVQYILGLIVIFVPLIINLVLSFIIIYSRGADILLIPTIQAIIGIIFFLTAQYTLFVFFAHKCNNMLDAIFINSSYLVLPAILVGSCATFFSNQVGNLVVSNAGWSEEFFTILNPDIISIISLPYTAIVYAFKVFTEAYSKLSIVSIINLFSWWMLVYWIIIMGVTYYFGRKSFIQRREEYAENRSTSLFTYPFISTAITFLLLLLVINITDSLFILSIIIIFLIYMGMLFFANRKIKIKIKYIVIFGVMFVSVYGCSSIFNSTKGFGLIQEVPTQSEIVSVEVDYNFSKNVELKIGERETEKYSGLNMVLEEENEITEMINIQKELIKDGRHGLYSGSIYVRYTFRLKDGKRISRSYYTRTSTVEEMINTQISSIISNEEKVNAMSRREGFYTKQNGEGN